MENFMAKIKRTKSGNIQITMTEEQAQAVRDLFGITNSISRRKVCSKFDCVWTDKQDEDYRVVYNLIDDFKG